MKAIGVFWVTISMIAAGSSRARQEHLRLKPPLGLDEYFFVPEDNPLTL